MTGVQTCALPIWISRGRFFEFSANLRVGRAVIGDAPLPVLEDLAPNGFDAVTERINGRVVDRRDDAEAGHGSEAQPLRKTRLASLTGNITIRPSFHVVLSWARLS